MSLQPQGARLIVKPDESVGETKSGIVIPDSAKKIPSRGVVVAIGRGDYEDGGPPLEQQAWPDGVPVYPKIGQRVLYSKYAGTEVREDGKDVVIMSTKDILAIIADDTEVTAITDIEA
jgi:chaperonin GroES